MGTEVMRLLIFYLEAGMVRGETPRRARWVRTFPRPDETLAFFIDLVNECKGLFETVMAAARHCARMVR